MIFKAESDPTFIKCIITGDETWVYEYAIQMSEWKASNEPRPKKPRRFQSTKKAMLGFHGLHYTLRIFARRSDS